MCSNRAATRANVLKCWEKAPQLKYEDLQDICNIQKYPEIYRKRLLISRFQVRVLGGSLRKVLQMVGSRNGFVVRIGGDAPSYSACTPSKGTGAERDVSALLITRGPSAGCCSVPLGAELTELVRRRRGGRIGSGLLKTHRRSASPDQGIHRSPTGSTTESSTWSAPSSPGSYPNMVLNVSVAAGCS